MSPSLARAICGLLGCYALASVLGVALAPLLLVATLILAVVPARLAQAAGCVAACACAAGFAWQAALRAAEPGLDVRVSGIFWLLCALMLGLAAALFRAGNPGLGGRGSRRRC